MIYFTEGSFDEMRACGQKLFERHYQELTLDKEYVKLDIDWDKYKKLCDDNILKVFVVKDDGKLIGYGTFVLRNHERYKKLKVASNDVLFLDKSYRNSGTGSNFVDYCEAKLKELGVTKIIMHIKYSNDFSPMLYGKGYKDEEKSVSKILR